MGLEVEAHVHRNEIVEYGTFHRLFNLCEWKVNVEPDSSRLGFSLTSTLLATTRTLKYDMFRRGFDAFDFPAVLLLVDGSVTGASFPAIVSNSVELSDDRFCARFSW
ncbi:MAG: hypothetical protein R3F38_04470 [Gammaproteobacteria bacterium]